MFRMLIGGHHRSFGLNGPHRGMVCVSVIQPGSKRILIVWIPVNKEWGDLVAEAVEDPRYDPDPSKVERVINTMPVNVRDFLSCVFKR